AQQQATEATASSSVAGFEPAGASNGERFSVDKGAAWKGKQGAGRWWWQVRFAEPRPIGAILQINGDHPTVLRNVPKRYVWRWSTDGAIWHNLRETEVMHERRLFRIHRLSQSIRAQYLRLDIFEADGEGPTLREAEFYDRPDATIPFGDWVVAVSTAEE